MQVIRSDDEVLEISSRTKHLLAVILAGTAAPCLLLWSLGFFSGKQGGVWTTILFASTLVVLPVLPWRPLHTRFELRSKRFTIDRKGFFPRPVLEGRWDQIARIYAEERPGGKGKLHVPILELRDGSKHPLVDGGAHRPEHADEFVQLLLDTVRKRHPEVLGARFLGED